MVLQNDFEKNFIEKKKKKKKFFKINSKLKFIDKI